ncbi:DNA-dependent metalloprotease WSS1-like [Quillaja saponaria]|uniref:DNA-dependent metalloprotease WSS1-like n=1 Tax=Quillaja saponaria TaxID=32244 RepID=A0AAD7LN23_QUISA|nr:DNA-dependent metalloprotease WSS1-like [Quillaja saponaria]
MNSGDLHKVWEIRALKKKPAEEEARKFLEKIAKQVQPIMRKHKWRVKVLSEMCPNNARLLGLNVGAGVHVKLRLRRPNRDWDFYPFEEVLDTMLHELCHNVHGPHNANFYKLWDELREECAELMAKGVSGTGGGFDLPGRRLGGFSHQPPTSSLRQTALAAAEKRVRLGSLLPSGPKRLGGDSAIMVALSPVQAAAMAAERRLHDDIWCGSHSFEVDGDEIVNSDTKEDPVHKDSIRGNSTLRDGPSPPFSGAVSRKRSRESDQISLASSSSSPSESEDLVHKDNISGNSTLREGSTLPFLGAVSQKRSHKSDQNSFSFSSSTPSECNFVDLSSPPSRPVPGHDRSEEPARWECGVCTLLNSPLAIICEVCGIEKPKDAATKYKFWACKFCTLENSVKLEKCSACDQWRYSHGTPVAVQAPNLST